MFLVPFEDRYFHSTNIRGRYWEAGTNGEPIILVHGLGGSIEQWVSNIKALSSKFRVYCLDMPGCGKSDPLPDKNYSLEVLSKYIDSFVRFKNIDNFSIIGLSMGGAICLRYALDFPQKVNKMVLVSSAALGPRMAFVFRVLTLPFIGILLGLLSRKQFAFFVRSMVFNPEIITDEIIDFYYPLIKEKATCNAFIQTLKANCSVTGLRHNVRKSIIANLHNINIPVLIIWGHQDRHMPEKNVLEAIKKMQSARLIYFDNCRHNPQFEKPDIFNSTVIDFLDS